jgi:hypothetical protein
MPFRKIVALAAVDEQQTFGPLHSLGEQVLGFGQGDEPDSRVFPAVDETLPELAGCEPAEEREICGSTEDAAQGNDDKYSSD